MLLEDVQRDQVQNPGIRGGQYDGRCRPIVMSSQPVPRRHAPAIAGLQAWETVLRHRSAQVVADAALMAQELRRHHRAHGVTAGVLRTGIAATISVEAGDGIETARLEVAAQDVAFGHDISMVAGDR